MTLREIGSTVDAKLLTFQCRLITYITEYKNDGTYMFHCFKFVTDPVNRGIFHSITQSMRNTWITGWKAVFNLIVRETPGNSS